MSISFQELPSAGEGVANYYLHGELENGTFVQISLVPMGGTVAERISINTDKATYFVELPFWKNCDSPGSLTRVEGNSVTHKISGEELVDSTEMFEESGFYEENRSFFEHLRTKKDIINDVSTGIQSVEIADCIRKRIREYKAD